MPNYGYISSYENAISLAYLYVQYIITKVIELKQGFFLLFTSLAYWKRVGDEFKIYGCVEKFEFENKKEG